MDGSIAETNNYFAQAPFVLNRSTLDTKVNWNASPNVNVFGRFSVLDFFTENGTNFGHELQGQPLGSEQPRAGRGQHLQRLAGDLCDDVDAAVRRALRLRPDEHRRGAVGHRREQRPGPPGPAGTNGPNAYEGGTPLFDLDTYADIGTTDTFMPYYRSDDQHQMVMNANWIKGNHNLRFGTDIYYQALNHTQPEISGGDSLGARGGFRFQAGPTQIQGGPSGNIQRLRVVPARRAESRRRLKLVEPYTTRNWQQPVCARSVAGELEDDDLVRHPLEYFPVPTRASRSGTLDVANNLMMIGGVGAVPEDLGEREQIAVRAAVGLTYRVSDGRFFEPVWHHQRSARAGAAAAHESPGGAQPARRRAQLARVRQPDEPGYPAIPDPDQQRPRHGAEPDYRLHAGR